jgi:hypothetical protein
MNLVSQTDEIISVVPHFSAMNNTEKFNFILSSQDLDK